MAAVDALILDFNVCCVVPKAVVAKDFCSQSNQTRPMLRSEKEYGHMFCKRSDPIEIFFQSGVVRFIYNDDYNCLRYGDVLLNSVKKISGSRCSFFLDAVDQVEMRSFSDGNC